jgi:hypothetical protein
MSPVRGPQSRFPGRYSAPPRPDAGSGAPRTPSAGLKWLARIQILVGALGMVGAPLGVLVGLPHTTALSLRIGSLTSTGAGGNWTFLHAAIAEVLAAVLVAGGVGLSTLRRWAPIVVVLQALAALALLAASDAFFWLYIYPALGPIIQSAGKTAAGRDELTVMMISGIASSILPATLPICSLVVLSRRSVRRQFQ